MARHIFAHDKLYQAAFMLARDMHAGQFRKFSNEPYIVHPLAVSESLRHVGRPFVEVVAGLLHDIIEDTPASAENLLSALVSQGTNSPNYEMLLDDQPEIADEISQIVQIVVAVSKLPGEKNGAYFSRLCVVLRKAYFIDPDLRLSMARVKLADCRHNLATLPEGNSLAKRYVAEIDELEKIVSELEDEIENGVGL